MDKNIKAELSDLRNEVLSNLKSLEIVVNKIDAKLSQFELVDEYTQQYMQEYNEMIDHYNKLDQESGKVVDNSKEYPYMEPMQSPGPYKCDPEGLKEARKLINDLDIAQEKIEKRHRKLKEYNISNDPFIDPIDNKTFIQIIKEASQWDEYTYKMFIGQWNNCKKRRIETLLSTINLFIADVKSLKHEEYKVNSLESAEATLTKMKKLEEMKQKIIDLCSDQSNFKNLLIKDTTDDYYKYYNIFNTLTEDLAVILDIAKSTDQSTNQNKIFELFKSMLEDQELNMFSYSSVDLNTFELIPLYGEKLRKFQIVAIKYYKKDLKAAFEFRAKHLNSREFI